MSNGMNYQVEKRSIPSKDAIFMKPQSIDDEYVRKIQNTTFFSSYDCSVSNQEWLSDLSQESIPNTKQIISILQLQISRISLQPPDRILLSP